MPQKRKTRQALKRGDNVVATIEEVIHDCLIVSFIFQNKKFCGALMDTTEKIGPFGITPPSDIKQESGDGQDLKYNVKNPFPKPLLLRQSYKQEVPQPPLKNIFRRTRRSKRKVKLGILQNSKEKLGGRLKEPHNGSCACKYCRNQTNTREKSFKRKMDETKVSPTHDKLKRVKLSDDTPSTSSDDETAAVRVIHEEITSPVKSLMPRKIQSHKKEIQRSPVIKITFKSPGGKGNVVKIPSKIHASPVKDATNPDPSNIVVTDKRNMVLGTFSEKTTIGCGFVGPDKPIKRQYRKKQLVHQATNIPDGEIHKAKYVSKKFTKQDQAMKVLKRVKRNSLSINAPLPLLKREENPMNYNKDLRVVLKPIDDKNGYMLSSHNCKLGDIVEQQLHEVFADLDSGNQEEFKGFTCQKAEKRVELPKSHTLTVTSCKTLNGMLTQGDVAWGKLTGYPWWPCRVTKIIVTKTDGKILQQEAVVAWFQSRTTSKISVKYVESFKKTFELRYQQKRKGLYQKAVSDAHNALKEITPEVRKLISQFET